MFDVKVQCHILPVTVFQTCDPLACGCGYHTPRLRERIAFVARLVSSSLIVANSPEVTLPKTASLKH